MDSVRAMVRARARRSFVAYLSVLVLIFSKAFVPSTPRAASWRASWFEWLYNACS